MGSSSFTKGNKKNILLLINFSLMKVKTIWIFSRFTSIPFLLGLVLLGTNAVFKPIEAFAQTTLLNEEGALQNGDEVAPDGSLYDVHTFEGQTGQEVTISLESNDFDTYLAVVSPSGDLIAESDDVSQSNTNSAVQRSLPSSGTYTVVVNAYSASERGRYTLLVTSSEGSSGLTTANASEARPGFELYRYQNFFSIEHPEGWYVEVSNQDSYPIIIWNRRPPSRGGGDWPNDLVKTEVILFPGDFSTASGLFFEGTDSVITRRGELTVGGRRALRVWTEGGGWPPGIVTFVEYTSDTTIILSSTYSNNAFIEDIQDIHWSFRLVN